MTNADMTMEDVAAKLAGIRNDERAHKIVWVERTDVWVVSMGNELDPTGMYRTVDEALAMVRVMMERVENDQDLHTV